MGKHTVGRMAPHAKPCRPRGDGHMAVRHRSLKRNVECYQISEQ
jgi:hypothetical protein